MAVEDVVEEIGPGLGETELGTAGDWADGVLVSSGTVVGKPGTFRGIRESHIEVNQNLGQNKTYK